MAKVPREELSRAVQAELTKRAPAHFEFDRLSKGKHVVFERSGLTEFHVTVANSPKHRSALEAAMQRGDLQVINRDFVEQLAQTHSRFLAFLYDANIRVPPTFIRLDGKPIPIGKPLPVESKMWVKKVSFDEKGNFFGHRGAGVSIFAPKQITDILPTHDHEFFQQFVVPQDNFLRDIRVYVVGDKIIPGYVRTATKPLTRGNYSGLYPPTEEQFVTAEHPGTVTPLEGELAKKVVAEAKKVRTAFIERLCRTKPEWRKQSIFDFGSMDFLLDAHGEPIIGEFDTSPEIRDIGNLRKTLASAVADHLVEKAGKTGTVHVIGDKRDDFIAKILVHLGKELKADQISQKQPLHRIALVGRLSG